MDGDVRGAVAVLGLGTMGGRAAGRLCEIGVPVGGYDPAPAARDLAAGRGVTVYDRPEAALRDAEVVVLSVPRPEQVMELAGGALGSAAPGAVVVDLSTIDPDTARAAAEAVAKTGGVYLDAPVLGRPEGCGKWTLVVGGPEAAVDRVRPLLERSVARQVVRIGDVGAGSVVKLLNNLMFGAINAVTAEAFNVCRMAGVDPETFASVVADSGAATVSGLFRELGRKIPANDFAPTFGLGLLAKDNRLAVRLAESSGSPSFMAHCVDQLNTLAERQGWAEQDTAAVYRLYQLLSVH